MNKTAIKNFSTYSRRKLIESTKDKCKTIGITEDSIESPVSSSNDFEIYNCYGVETTLDKNQIKQRNSLIKEINDKGFNQVVEEVAYTWFNRLIAVRFMEVNDYLPSRQRVLSSIEDARIESDLMRSPNESDIDFTSDELNYVYDLKEQNNTNELFKFLFIKECNKLNEYLPELFEKTDDYTELLFNISFDDKDDVIYKLVHDIEESNFDIEQEGQVEIIGWFYQYYNTERNELVYNGSMSKSRISKDLLPAATTIYTPDWAIKYMIENSLGKLWYEGHPSNIRGSWRYYIEEVQQEESVQQQLNEMKKEYYKLNIEDIKFIDSCMGSGHILVYAFDVFMQIYLEQGYSEKNATKTILENNIYGLEIDKRAYQLSYFALMMKARQYNRRILNSSIDLHLCEIKESPKVSTMDIFDRCGEYREIALKLYSTFVDAKEYGSILNIDISLNEIAYLEEKLAEIKNDNFSDLVEMSKSNELFDVLQQLIPQAKVFATKYDVVVTNPPYLSSSRFSDKLLKYVNKNFKNEKADLSSVMYKNMITNFLKENGFISFITTSSWMTLSTFEKYRKKLIEDYSFSSMVDFGTELFEGKVGHNPIVSWVMRKSGIKQQYTSIRLVDFCYSNRDKKEPEFFNRNNYYNTSQDNFSKIPGSPIAYWVSNKYFNIFKNYNKLSNYGKAVEGIKTGNNDLYLRTWFEINRQDAKLTLSDHDDTKWRAMTKGGSFRRWYGNLEYVVLWGKNGEQLDSLPSATISNKELFNSPALNWSYISSKKFSVRTCDDFVIHNNKGPAYYVSNDIKIYILALMNTNCIQSILDIIAPTMDYKPGNINNIPITIDNNLKNDIEIISNQNLNLSKSDWDSFEISWDFKIHPLVKNHTSTIKEAYNLWNKECNDRFYQLKANEEELNRIYINIYGLQDELTPEIEDKDVTIRKADLTRDIKSFISYAVGCMFGRYSLDEEGLVYAGGIFDINSYHIFRADKDNILPICDEEYFDDDIVVRFIDFVRTAYDQDTLEENLNFIANALNTNGLTSREKIRNYFIKDFFKDHCQTYSVTGSGKRPIYWLFESGKQNGFKALIYMHRYDEDTVGIVRTDYLHKVQSAYEDAIKNDEYIIENSNIKSDINKASKHRDKLLKQLEETRIYDQALAHMANKRISIDLDDGVKHNYALFQGIEVSKEGSKTKKIDLLAKIK